MTWAGIVADQPLDPGDQRIIQLVATLQLYE